MLLHDAVTSLGSCSLECHQYLGRRDSIRKLNAWASSCISQWLLGLKVLWSPKKTPWSQRSWASGQQGSLLCGTGLWGKAGTNDGARLSVP